MGLLDNVKGKIDGMSDEDKQKMKDQLKNKGMEVKDKLQDRTKK